MLHYACKRNDEQRRQHAHKSVLSVQYGAEGAGRRAERVAAGITSRRPALLPLLERRVSENDKALSFWTLVGLLVERERVDDVVEVSVELTLFDAPDSRLVPKLTTCQ